MPNTANEKKKLVFSCAISNYQSKSLKQISTVLLHGTSVSNSSWETLMRDFKQFKCQLQRRHGFKVLVICLYWALVIRTWCQVAVIHSRWISRGAVLIDQLIYSVKWLSRQGLSYLQFVCECEVHPVTVLVPEVVQENVISSVNYTSSLYLLALEDKSICSASLE